MLKSILKKLLLILFLALLGGLAASFIFIADPPKKEAVMADTTDNVYGWAWSENVGWVSFNCVQQYCTGNPAVRCGGESDCAGIGNCEFDAGNCSGPGRSNYGVDYNKASRKLSGYAWNDNIGWIYLGQSGAGFPSGGTSQWARENSGNILGWAKIINMDPQGWVQMDHDRANPVTISDYEFYGWAWNRNDDGAGVGWVSFNCANHSGCGASDYKVFISDAPSATGLSDNFSAACPSSVITVTLSWVFDDDDPAAVQSAYEVEVRDGGGGLILDTGKQLSGADQRIVNSGLNYGQTYSWKVKVWDNYNLSSDWASDSFTTPAHQYPTADFTWGPSSAEQGTSFSPKALEDVYFADASTAYGGASIAATDWLFTDALPNSSTTPNPGPVQFQSSGDKAVTLAVTDSDGYSCEETQNITTKMSLPIWKEIRPE